MHSEVLTLAAECAAADHGDLAVGARALRRTPRQRAIDVEEIVVQRCFQLLTSILRLAVTRDAACYNPKVIDTHVPTVLEIAGNRRSNTQDEGGET